MVESKAIHDDLVGGRVMTRPVGFRSGRARQAIASSRSGSNFSGGSFSSRPIAAAWSRASRLSNRCPGLAAEPLARAWAVSDSKNRSRASSRAWRRSARCLNLAQVSGRSGCAARGKSRPRRSRPMARTVVRKAAAMLAPARPGLRRHHRQNRSTAEIGRERIGRSSTNRRRSSPISCAVANRSPGSLASAFRTIVSRSRGILRSSLRGGSAASWSTFSISSSWSGSAERRAQGQQLVERRAQGVEVAPAIRPAAEPLGGHVAQGPDQVVRAGRAVGSSTLARPKSVTQTLPRASSSRFDGLMSRCRTPLLVGVGQRVGDLKADPRHGAVELRLGRQRQRRGVVQAGSDVGRRPKGRADGRGWSPGFSRSADRVPIPPEGGTPTRGCVRGRLGLGRGDGQGLGGIGRVFAPLEPTRQQRACDGHRAGVGERRPSRPAAVAGARDRRLLRQAAEPPQVVQDHIQAVSLDELHGVIVTP